ncbi:hypothetical protein [Megasphaera sp.]|uniref:hypothetical protein n=1 Tax=Megasphaera sp. TaxID=2023260 RepID=UPI001DEC993A|nr:hypothetical protein [Megasphaera sp.]MBS6104703.1 hypothetical protein [Megasphaera sp.]
MSYLPQLREEVDRFVKSPQAIIICIIVVLIVATGGWLLCRYYDDVERAKSDNVTQTVRYTEKLNRDAQGKLKEARDDIDAAERANSNAQRAADDVSESNEELSELNRSDAAAINAAEQVFSCINAANKCAEP